MRAIRHVPTLVCVLGLSAATPVLAQPDNIEALAGAEALGWSTGTAEAPVLVVEFTDPLCPFCATFHAGTRAALHEDYVSSGQVRWITLTYVSGSYGNSEPVSIAAECAGRQDRYEAFLEAAYGERERLWGRSGAEIWREVDRFSAELGLDEAEFEACLEDPSVAARLAEVQELASRTGVRGTPTWFVDGFLVMGDLPLAYARQFLAERLPGGVE